MRLLSKHKSDTWDKGNFLTQFYECCYECDECCGTGEVYDFEQDLSLTCEKCNGLKEVIVYE